MTADLNRTLAGSSTSPSVIAPLGVAIIGAGYWGLNLLRNFAASPQFDVRWVVDPAVPKRVHQIVEDSGARFARDLDSILDDPRLNSVAIATPADTHEALIAAALQAGLHVLAEKPFATSTRGARLLVEAASARGLVLMVDHTYCYSSAVTTLRGLVTAGEMGEIAYINATRTNVGSIRSDVDVIWDLAPHDFSILDSLLGPSVRVSAIQAVGAPRLGEGPIHVAQLTVHLSNGGFASIHVNWSAPEKVRNIVVGGRRLTAIWNDLDPGARVRIIDSTSGESRMSPHSGRTDADVTETEDLRRVVDAFANSIRSGTAPLTDGRRSLRVVAMLEATSESLRRGGIRVELPVATED